MQLKRLDHVNVRTSNLAEMISWYEDILGLVNGWRPDFGFPGAWMYLGDDPIVHLVGQEAEPASVDPKLEHFAISAEGLDEFRARLDARGIAHSVDPVPGLTLVQVNLRDCDGNHIHIDFDD